MMISDDGGESWQSPRHVITSGSDQTRPSVKYISDGAERFDLLYTQGHPRQEKNNVYHLYYQEGALHRSDGTQICSLAADDCLPIRVGQGTQVYDAEEADRAWVWDIEYDDGGAPVAAFVVARDSTVGQDLRSRYARYDSEAETWRGREIAHAGTRLYEGENHYAGGIALDPSNSRRVYISSDVDPKTGDTTETGRYQIYRGTVGRRGERWRWTRLTATEAVDNLRPFLPREESDRHVVLWLRGRYSTYTEYDTDVVGSVQ